MVDISPEDILQHYEANSIKQMALRRGITGITKRPALIRKLAPALFDAEAIDTAVSDLTSLERLLLDRVILAGGAVLISVIREQLRQEGQVESLSGVRRLGFSSYYEEEKGSSEARGSRQFPDLVARLGVLGLAFTSDPLHSSGRMVSLAVPGHRLYVPDAVTQRLPAVNIPVEKAPLPVHVEESDTATLLRDLYLLVSFASQERIMLTKAGLINKRFLVRIEQALQFSEDVASVRSEEELAWLPLLRGLAEELGLLIVSVGELLPGPHAEAFLHLPAGQRLHRLFDAYHQTTHWCELYRIPGVKVRGSGASLHRGTEQTVKARQRVLAEVAELPAGEWVPLEHLIIRLRQRAYELLFSREYSRYGYFYGYYGQPHHPYDGDNEMGLSFDVADGPGRWDVIEGGFIRVVVSEALHVLGVVDLGFPGDDGAATAFRITPSGARLLRGEALESEASAANVVVQPNFQIFAFEPTGEDILFTLDRLAERVRVAQAIEYELTRDSVYRAQRSGLDSESIIAFLERVSTVGLPQNVRRSIEEWGAQHERVTVRPRTALLQTADAATLDSLYADPEVARLLGRRIAPCVALARSDTLGPLVDLLVARNLLPALTEGASFVTGPQIEVDPAGQITFRHRVPSAYVLHTLGSFVDDGGDGTLGLTPDGLRRGAKSGLSAADVIATLARLTDAPLPPDVPALVRRWAKDWGSGAIIQATILQVDRPEALADLLADRQVKPWLQPIPDAPTLAIVRPDGIEPLRALLESLGMTLEGHLITGK